MGRPARAASFPTGLPSCLVRHGARLGSHAESAPDVATLDQASHLLLQTLATNRHPAHDRKGAHPDSWGARGRGDVADPEVLAAHDGDAGQVHLDALGHDYVDPAHEGHGGDDDLRTVDLGVAQVELAASHERHRLGVGPGTPAPGAARPAHDGDRPPCRRTSSRLRHRRLHRRQIVHHLLQIGVRAGCEGEPYPLGELVEREAPLGRVEPKELDGLVAVGVGYAHDRIPLVGGRLLHAVSLSQPGPRYERFSRVGGSGPRRRAATAPGARYAGR